MLSNLLKDLSEIGVVIGGGDSEIKVPFNLKHCVFYIVTTDKLFLRVWYLVLETHRVNPVLIS